MIISEATFLKTYGIVNGEKAKKELPNRECCSLNCGCFRL